MLCIMYKYTVGRAQRPCHGSRLRPADALRCMLGRTQGASFCGPKRRGLQRLDSMLADKFSPATRHAGNAVTAREGRGRQTHRGLVAAGSWALARRWLQREPHVLFHGQQPYQPGQPCQALPLPCQACRRRTQQRHAGQPRCERDTVLAGNCIVVSCPAQSPKPLGRLRQFSLPASVRVVRFKLPGARCPRCWDAWDATNQRAKLE
jgi:hypothetical protein